LTHQAKGTYYAVEVLRGQATGKEAEV